MAGRQYPSALGNLLQTWRSAVSGPVDTLLFLQSEGLPDTLDRLPCRCAGTKVLLSHYKHCTSAEGCLLCDPVRSLTTGEHAVAGLPLPLPGAAVAASALAEERTPAPPMPSTRWGQHCTGATVSALPSHACHHREAAAPAWG